ncbi:hypothetical protein [Saccharothrix deserti]|uniref:hypothetical protein n=1 Tax=Saccharothrix deserti TaxID=2593674 RepID=UPI00131D27BA|nr:hypothetical protein [Saccharothrix deserti]
MTRQLCCDFPFTGGKVKPRQSPSLELQSSPLDRSWKTAELESETSTVMGTDVSSLTKNGLHSVRVESSSCRENRGHDDVSLLPSSRAPATLIRRAPFVVVRSVVSVGSVPVVSNPVSVVSVVVVAPLSVSVGEPQPIRSANALTATLNVRQAVIITDHLPERGTLTSSEFDRSPTRVTALHPKVAGRFELPRIDVNLLETAWTADRTGGVRVPGVGEADADPWAGPLRRANLS